MNPSPTAPKTDGQAALEAYWKHSSPDIEAAAVLAAAQAAIQNWKERHRITAQMVNLADDRTILVYLSQDQPRRMEWCQELADQINTLLFAESPTPQPVREEWEEIKGYDLFRLNTPPGKYTWSALGSQESCTGGWRQMASTDPFCENRTYRRKRPVQQTVEELRKEVEGLRAHLTATEARMKELENSLSIHRTEAFKTDEAHEKCKADLTAAKTEIEQTHREYDEVKRLLDVAHQENDDLRENLTAAKEEMEKAKKGRMDDVGIYNAELTRLRAENAWVAVTERMPTAEDADRSGNVELICITDDPLNIYFGAPSDLTAEKTAFTHWRRTNLPALPAPIVDDAAFTKAANHLGYALTDREKAIAKDFWGAAQQSTGGNK